MENRVALTGTLAELAALRYTPAGLPALDLRIEHSSQQAEAGSKRNVTASVKAVAFGPLAEKLARQAPGSQWTFQGFLATPRNTKMLVLHIQDIQQN
ncbi:primosomal replication protein N [Comamonas sp. w2-DMI]|uniref:Replication restart protein PriB n=1 Tax=Comamonas terrae TaxID=673548 RepID=A0ABW5UHB9_9BURK|nr:primosomal replication protein N [Comamonas terrae]